MGKFDKSKPAKSRFAYSSTEGLSVVKKADEPKKETDKKKDSDANKDKK